MQIDRIIINSDKDTKSIVIVIGQLKAEKGKPATMARKSIELTKDQEAKICEFVDGLISK